MDRDGWVKPQRARTVPELRELIAFKRRELAELQAELQALEEGPRLQALVEIRNIMRARDLTLDDLEISPERPAAVRVVRARAINAPLDKDTST